MSRTKCPHCEYGQHICHQPGPAEGVGRLEDRIRKDYADALTVIDVLARHRASRADDIAQIREQLRRRISILSVLVETWMLVKCTEDLSLTNVDRVAASHFKIDFGKLASEVYP